MTQAVETRTRVKSVKKARRPLLVVDRELFVWTKRFINNYRQALEALVKK